MRLGQADVLAWNRWSLKVPKSEIFDRSDFHYFYTIKPFWVDDFVVKILTTRALIKATRALTKATRALMDL
jgi:hypothetical protein